MVGRLAFRSLAAHPISSVLHAAGFGVCVAFMAILLGAAEVVLDQAQSPALVGGGDVTIRLGPQVPARLLLSGTLQADALRDRIDVAAPTHTTDLYLIPAGGREGPSLQRGETEDGPEGPSLRRQAIRVGARGGIPSLERALRDPEVQDVEGWRDSPADVEWLTRTPAALLRHIDRFHPIPSAPA